MDGIFITPNENNTSPFRFGKKKADALFVATDGNLYYLPEGSLSSSKYVFVKSDKKTVQYYYAKTAYAEMKFSFSGDTVTVAIPESKKQIKVTKVSKSNYQWDMRFDFSGENVTSDFGYWKGKKPTFGNIPGQGFTSPRGSTFDFTTDFDYPADFEDLAMIGYAKKPKKR